MTDTWNVRPPGWRRHRGEPVALEGVAVVAPQLLSPAAVLELTGCWSDPLPFIQWPAPPPEIGVWAGVHPYVFAEHRDAAGNRWTDSLPLEAWHYGRARGIQRALADLLDSMLADIADEASRPLTPEPDVMIVHEGRLAYPFAPPQPTDIAGVLERAALMLAPNPRYPEETDHA